MRRPPFPVFPVLHDTGFRLRAIEDDDLPDLIPISFYNRVPGRNLDEARQILQRIRLDYERGRTVHWGITVIGEEKILGTCGFYRGFEDDCGEIGFVLKPAYQGQGVMTRALTLVTRFGFEEMGLTSIAAVTHAGDQSLRRLLSRLHFQFSRSVEREFVEFSLPNMSPSQGEKPVLTTGEGV